MTSSITRRNALVGLGLVGAGIVAGRSLHYAPESALDHHGFDRMNMKTPDEALARLVAGNKCYTEEHFEIGNLGRTHSRRQEVAPSQHPYAVVLSCADSRVAPEIVFTAGLGDLFVVRVAGTIASPHCRGVLGSIEYAVAELHIPLILVLGHQSCGAVKAAIEYVEKGNRPPGAIGDIVDAIRPAIESVAQQSGDPLENAVEANVRQSVAGIVNLEELVTPRIGAGGLKVVGGVYELKTGLLRLLR